MCTHPNFFAVHLFKYRRRVHVGISPKIGYCIHNLQYNMNFGIKDPMHNAHILVIGPHSAASDNNNKPTKRVNCLIVNVDFLYIHICRFYLCIEQKYTMNWHIIIIGKSINSFANNLPIICQSICHCILAFK